MTVARAPPPRSVFRAATQPVGASTDRRPVSKRNCVVVFWFGVLWLAFVPTAWAAPQREQKELFLQVGQQVSLAAQDVKSYSLGAPGIVELRLSKEGDQFVLVALTRGTTTLLFFMLDGREVHHRIEVSQEKPEVDHVIRVSAEDNIRLDFYFVQVSQDYGHQLGLGFPGRDRKSVV